MTPKSFVYLAMAAVLSVLFAIVSYASNNQWSQGRLEGEKLFPALDDNLSRVTAIRLRQGEETLTLEKTGASWGVKDRAGYPVDFTKLRVLLVGLGRAELIESKTRRPDRYSALELGDPAAKGAKSRLVRLTGAKGDVLAEVVLGKKRQELYGVGKPGTYVRKPGNPQTWLTNMELHASLSAKDWMKTNILTLDPAKIAKVTIEIPGEEALKIERAGAGGDTAQGGKDVAAKLAFVGFPPEGKKLKDAGAAEGIAQSLASIDLEDVRKLASTPTGAAVVKIEVEKGPAITLRLRKEGDTHWLSVEATGEGEGRKTAEEIAGRTKGWEYKIPAYKADTILKKRSDLLEAAG
jgi:hypothetical protein